ncbi:MAG TPA: hypothetical protein DEP36_10540 [Gammaproteobacteria bacterium]|nr:hypothetical protein [Gammaproteobacteria bacterium]HRF45673.1 PilZ domain-containing protein [Candidatus Competibacteraceae bacterium]
MAEENETEQNWAIEDDWSEENRRQYERYSTNFYLYVYEQHEGRFLGHVVDISMGGLRLLGSDLLCAGEMMLLRMDISLESGRHESCEFQARAVWSGQDEDSELYIAGFEFLNLSEQGEEILQNIIAELGG